MCHPDNHESEFCQKPQIWSWVLNVPETSSESIHNGWWKIQIQHFYSFKDLLILKVSFSKANWSHSLFIEFYQDHNVFIPKPNAGRSKTK